MKQLEMNRSLARKGAAFEKAKQAFIDEALKQQRACKHEVVWELRFDHKDARRMCVACRYEEAWDVFMRRRKRKDGQHQFRSVLDNCLFAPPLSRDEFFAKRLPISVPDYVEIDFAEEARREAAKFPYMPCPNQSYPLDPLERCGDCEGSGYHRSIPNPDFVPRSAAA